MSGTRLVADLALKLVLGATLAVFALLALLPHTGLYRPETVLSRSMSPYFGSLMLSGFDT